MTLRSSQKLAILPENPDKKTQGRFPSWLHRKIPAGGQLFKTDAILDQYRVNTVCEEAKCPNRMECYAKKTATFLTLGKKCTRNCAFCDVDFSKTPPAPEVDEPERVAYSVAKLRLLHVVLTMVARDDLPDGGAHALARILRKTKEINPSVTIEVLTSDFAGNFSALDCILEEKPDIFNHNVETVEELSPRIRHKASYHRTLSILRHAKLSGLPSFIKSGLMLGLGEKQEQVHATLRDLVEAGCDIITIGQYLQASNNKLPLKAFITPEEFAAYRDYAYSIGARYVYSSPFVRSSYNAADILEKMQ